MKYFYAKYMILGIVILSFFSYSCTSNLDFNQSKDFIIEPVIVSNLATFEMVANQFVDGGIEQQQSTDVPNYDIFKGTFFKNNLTKVEFFFEIDNTIRRDFVIDIVLLDANYGLLHSISIPMPAYAGVKQLITKKELFESNFDVLASTTQIAFTISLKPGPALTESSLGSLKLRSSATGYFSVK